MNIYNFDIYIFDFDGVILNSEYYHYLSYNNSFKKMNIDFNLTFEDYCKINHSCKLSFNEILYNNYDEIYKLKTEYYNNYIKNNNIELIEGFENFYSKLLLKGKKIIIVTDSTKEIIEQVSKKFPFLKTLNNIISRDEIKLKKPNNNGYLFALEKIYKSYFDKDIYMQKLLYFYWS
jgi:beta-phosphoglucomutase-like phosphatase (HAD superfamily)